MATEERLPPACAFALSVLAERNLDPEAVPEEAVEAAQQHMITCARCANGTSSAASVSTTQRKKKKVRRVAESDAHYQPAVQTLVGEAPPRLTKHKADAPSSLALTQVAAESASTEHSSLLPIPVTDDAQVALTGALSCEQCRQVLSEYAEAMDSGQNVAALYPEVQEHLLNCQSGCLILLDLFKQEAKATRKYRRRPVYDPFRAMFWIVTGFFRLGQVTMAPMALSYGALILILLFASLSTYWHEQIYHPIPPAPHLIPTPDGIGLSDGTKIFDACNAASYQDKRLAAQAIQQHDTTRADTLLKAAVDAVENDTTGCNSAEAAIYREDLHVRQAGHPFSSVIVSFDSGPGNADPQGGTDRHLLYAAYTQELAGAFISQQQYNSKQLLTPGAPLMYLVLANTTGSEAGALQITNTIASLMTSTAIEDFGLLARGQHSLMAVVGFGPSSLVRVVLPVLCRAGVPLLSPTATGQFIIDLLTQTSLYRHCTPGFAFIRFSPDDAAQSALGAKYAYQQLHVHNAAIFYDPSNPSSAGSARGFSDTFQGFPKAYIVAQETAVASGLLDANGRPQASREDLLAGLQDALNAKPYPELIFAPLLTNDVISLAQAIAKLPQNQQPILMIGGEFVQPAALQGLVQRARQQQLALPHVLVVQSTAARPPKSDWQKQFYSTFCTSFATPGSFCSGTAALDQGALLIGDAVELIARGLGSTTDANALPSTATLVNNISNEQFDGVSCPITLHLWDDVLVTSKQVSPIILGIQQDGSIQIVG